MPVSLSMKFFFLFGDHYDLLFSLRTLTSQLIYFDTGLIPFIFLGVKEITYLQKIWRFLFLLLRSVFAILLSYFPLLDFIFSLF